MGFKNAADGFTGIDNWIENSFISKGGLGDIHGFMKPSRFGVQFNLPNDIFNAPSKNNVQEFLTNNIESIAVPQFELSSTESALRHSLERRSVSNISCTFFEDQSMSIKHAMWTWMNQIIQHDDDINNQARMYLDEIKAEIEVYPIKLDGNIGSRYDHFFDVFPTSISSQDYDFQQEDSIGKTTVQFAYRYHLIKDSST